MALSSLVGATATGFAWLLALRVLEGLGFCWSPCLRRG